MKSREIGAREAILGRLRQQKRSTPPPVPGQSSPEFEDLTDQFGQALSAVHGEVRTVANLKEALAVVCAELEATGARNVVVNGDSPVSALALQENVGNAVRVADAAQLEPDVLREFCQLADVGVSGAEIGIANTGTAVISSGQGRSRLATLLPAVHIALLARENLTADLTTWVKQRTDPQPANVILVSGPSKSADIAQTLTVGVHGPGRFLVILYGHGV